MSSSLRIRVLSSLSPQMRAKLTSESAVFASEDSFSAEQTNRAILLENLEPEQAHTLRLKMQHLGGAAYQFPPGLPATEALQDTLLLGNDNLLSLLSEQAAEESAGLEPIAAQLATTLRNFHKQAFSFKVGHHQFDLGAKPLIMGILNVTPDSFSDGGQFVSVEAAVVQAKKLITEGADIIDVGGESSRPGSEPVSLEDEKSRTWPVIEAIAELGIPVSIDTYKAEVALGALERGAAMVNDISALNFDERMAEVTASHDAALVLMHMQGKPQDMQQNPSYGNLMGEILDYLVKGIEKAVAAGVDRAKIILDPGIGFGKTLTHNLETLNRLEEFRALGQPLLIGTSRKSFIGTLTGRAVNERSMGTAASLVWAIEHGAHILRVHEVAAARDLREVTCALRLGGEFTLEET